MKIEQKKAIDLAVGFDENYLVHFYVLMTSVIKNNKVNKINLHAIATGLSLAERNDIIRFSAKNNINCYFYDVNTDFIQTFAVSNDPRYTIAVYFRLFFPYLLSSRIEKILYLDIDTCVVGDLAPLYNLELNSAIAVASDGDAIHLGILEYGQYFNSGVMLINLKEWRDLEVTSKCIKFLSENPEKAPYHDQDALNVVLKGHWQKLDKRFNLTFRDIPVLDKKQINSFIAQQVIIHYNDAFKPWSIHCNNKLSFIYYKYLRLFLNSVLGKHLLATNSNIILTSIIGKFQQSYRKNGWESLMTLAFCLHLSMLKAISYENYQISQELVIQYYSYDQINSPIQRTREFEKLYIDNKVFFENTADQIGYLEINGENNQLTWLKHWTQFCRNHLVSNKACNLTELAESVNAKLQLTGSLKSLVHFLVSKFYDQSLTS